MSSERNSVWYVIQVAGGREQATRDLIARKVDAGVLEEAFVPRRETMRHRSGQWVKTPETLFPGYVFVVTDYPEALLAQLRRVPAFARLLGVGERFVSVSEAEMDLINGLCGKERVLRMSEGIIEGSEIRVLSGPLHGQEGLIRKIDRHKRAAYVEMPMFGRQMLVKVGLEIVRKLA